MKKSNLLLLSLVAAAIHTAYASNDAKTICNQWIDNYNDVHCTYITGLESNTNIGRYIKHYDSRQDTSYTRCVTADMVEDDIFQGVAEYYVGTRQVEYSICSDSKAENCERVGTDTYTIVSNGDKYVGTPASFAINLSAVKDKYPTCVAINQPSLKHPFVAKH